jgi:hypothetical protein
MESRSIRLISLEGEKFDISKKSANMSLLLRGAIEDYEGDITIPLEETNSKILRKVIEYLDHWDIVEPPKIKTPIDSPKMSKIVDQWSANFIDSLTLEEVGDLAIAANFMQIQQLEDLACCKIAAIGISKPIEELFIDYGMDPLSFTEIERQKIREENIGWLNDNPEEFLKIE